MRERLRSKKRCSCFSTATCACTYTLLPGKTTTSPIYIKAPSILPHFSSPLSYRAIRRFSTFQSLISELNNSLKTTWSLPDLNSNFNKMIAKVYVKATLLFTVIGFVFGVENYIDYGDETADQTPAENIHELYRLLMQRAALENAGFGEVPLEHLMIRKSQRSPSLRLRFGRSDPHLPMALLSRRLSGIVPPRFEDN